MEGVLSGLWGHFAVIQVQSDRTSGTIYYDTETRGIAHSPLGRV